jgi:hypothetical protein
VVGIHQWIGLPRRQDATFDRGPWAPRVGCNVNRELLAPVAINFGCRDPLTTHKSRLHWVLGPKPLHDWSSVAGNAGPSIGRAVLQWSSNLANGYSRQPHCSGRMWPVEPAPFAHQILLEGVAEQVRVVARSRNRVAINGQDAAVLCQPKAGPGQCCCVIGRQIGGFWMPSQSIARPRFIAVFGHLHPEDDQLAIDQFTAHRPEPLR